MRRSAIAVCVALAVTAGAWTTRKSAAPEAGTAAAGLAPAATAPDRVSVEHQLVEVKDVTAEPAPVQARAAVRAAAHKRAARKPGFFGKMRRVLFGGGQHKPSPFPAAPQ